MTDCITTKRLRLRPLVAADSDAVVEILNDLEVSRWLVPIPHPFTHADLRIVNADGSNRWPELAAIVMDGTLIGGIGMGPRLGYYLSPHAWGKGLGREAAGAAVDHTFAETETNEIQSGYFEGNCASARILTGLGFRETGRSLAYCTALMHDMLSVDMRIDRSDWQRAA